VLGHGGRTPLALADGHGAWLHWLDGAGSYADHWGHHRTMFGS